MNTHAKIGKNEVAEITAKYHSGQQIYRRASVGPLLKYIAELEARLTPVPADGAVAPIKCAECGDEIYPVCEACVGDMRRR